MSERRCYVCDRCYKDGRPLRIFILAGEKEPRCPEHGKMRREHNKPYRPK